MITFSLQSGSNGNAIYVEAGGFGLLFDAGISGRQAECRLDTHGRDIRNVDALFISHEHADHIRCAGIYQRKYGIPLYITRACLAAAPDLGPLRDVRHFQAGDCLEFGKVRVHAIPTPHDATDPVAFIVSHEGRRLGIFTDLGHPNSSLLSLLRSVDAAYLESNYDPRLLADGPYPPELKARIRGKGGHLSNSEAADLLRRCGRERPAWVALAHLSEQNNSPGLALHAHRSVLGSEYPLAVAGRYGVSDLMKL